MTAELAASLTEVETWTLRRYEDVIDRGLHTFVEVGEALAAIRDKRLYRDSHGTFETYCEKRWNLTRKRAYDLMGAAATVLAIEAVSPMGDKIASERQARELAGLSPETAAAVVEQAAESGKVTAASLAKAREEIAPKPAKPAKVTTTTRTTEATKVEQDVDLATGEVLNASPGPVVVPPELAAPERSYMTKFFDALVKANGPLMFDAERVGREATEAEWPSIVALRRYAEFVDRAERARRGLRLVDGGNA